MRVNSPSFPRTHPSFPRRREPRGAVIRPFRATKGARERSDSGGCPQPQSPQRANVIPAHPPGKPAHPHVIPAQAGSQNGRGFDGLPPPNYVRNKGEMSEGQRGPSPSRSDSLPLPHRRHDPCRRPPLSTSPRDRCPGRQRSTPEAGHVCPHSIFPLPFPLSDHVHEVD